MVFVVLDHERQLWNRPGTVGQLRAVEVTPRSLHMGIRLAAAQHAQSIEYLSGGQRIAVGSLLRINPLRPTTVGSLSLQKLFEQFVRRLLGGLRQQNAEHQRFRADCRRRLLNGFLNTVADWNQRYSERLMLGQSQHDPHRVDQIRFVLGPIPRQELSAGFPDSVGWLRRP